MGKAISKFRLLMWKNWLLHYRHPYQTMFEILMPVLFAILLVILRMGIDLEKHTINTIYNPFDPINKSLLIFAYRENVAWSPAHPDLDKIMKKAVKMLDLNETSYKNEEEMINKLTSDNHTTIENTLLGVVFEDDLANRKTIRPDEIKIQFRYPSETYFVTHPTYNWHTNLLFPKFYTRDPTFSDKEEGGPPTGYYWHGFLAIQDAISKCLLEHFSTNVVGNSTIVQLIRYPYPQYNNDPLVAYLRQIAALMIMLSFAYTAISVVRMITKEKEEQLKEAMKIMGLPNWLHWLAWFCTISIIMLLSVALYVALVKIRVNQQSHLAVFTYSDGTLLFVFMWLYIITIICFCFMISAFFHSANSAALTTGFLWLLLFTPYLYVAQEYERLPISSKLFFCLAFNTAMACGMNFFIGFEGRGKGAQWNTIWVALDERDKFVLGHVMIMLILDAFLYFIITLYIEAIWTGSHGTPKSYLFFLKKSYWFSVATDEKRRQSLTIQKLPATAEYEKEPSNLPVGIQITHLQKEYGNIAAVEDLSLNLFEGQITVLLGHNGAGKTTTMAMLTGLLRPTSGTAIIGGYDICTARNAARQSLGLCPQHNILFDELTVREHIYFFGKLKGMDKHSLEADISKFIEVLELQSKENSQSSTLSGGMKRKLCVCIALCGNSEVVIFDEPSSGMDPSARRALWQMLEMEKQKRTILISTHMMDEADFLGDRIAIITRGRLQCCGSPFFLKRKYGAGYNLVIVKDQGSNVTEVTNIVKRHIPTVAAPQIIGSDLSYRVSESESGKFEAMLSELENSKRSLNIKSYGLSLTTMEEVFMKVGRGGEMEDKKTDESKKKSHAAKGSSTIFSLVISKGPLCSVTGVTKTLQKYFPNITLIENKSSELWYSLDPNEREQFKEMLKDLEQKKYMLGIGSFYIKYSLKEGDKELEEYLLKRSHSIAYTPFTDSEQDLLMDEEVKTLTGWSLWWNRANAMILKKATYTIRTFKLYLILVLLMIILVFLVVLLTNVWGSTDLPARRIDLAKYQHPSTVVGIQKNSEKEAHSIYYEYKSLIAKTKSDLIDLGTSENIIQNMTDYIISKAKNQLLYFRRHYIVAATFSTNSQNKTLATGWFNHLPYHSIPLAMNLIYNAIFRAYDTGASLLIINYPLPFTKSTKVQSKAKHSDIAFELVLSIGFFMALFSAFFVIFNVNEKETKSKLLQMLAGVNEYTYWGISFLWDFLLFLIPVCIILFIFFSFQEAGFSSKEELGRLCAVFVCFGWSMLSYIYLLSFFISSPVSGFVKTAGLNLLTGFTSFLVIFVLSATQFGVAHITDTVEWFLFIIPHYSLCSCIYKLHTRHVYINSCPQQLQFCYVWGFRSKCCFDFCDSNTCKVVEDEYFAWENPGIGREITFLLVTGFIYLILLLLLDRKVFNMLLSIRKFSPAKISGEQEEIDSDVQIEKDKIHNEDITVLVGNHSILLKDVSKYYGQFLAVKELCIAIEEGECFGLLGENGAGKSTTFKMLTGDIKISKGEAYMEGFNMRTKIKEVRNKIGYCPQFDALLEDLTGRESLTMFCLLRGIPMKNCSNIVNVLAEELLFTEHIDKKIKEYSGGNRRKLSIAVALAGDPPIILLDEPTTGMDPVAKRQLWNVICKVRDSGKSIILTSHSMEECEALCTRVAIMVNGTFKCLGSIQHLKNKFAKGYILNVKVKKKKKRKLSDTSQEQVPIKKYVTTNIKGAVLREEYQGVLTFYIPHNEDLKWPAMFGIMETAKQKSNIEDYTLGQTNLDQVFLSFTKYQK